MRVTPIKTNIVTQQDSIENLIDTYITEVSENTVLVITSKILSIVQGDIAGSKQDKTELIQKECEWYIPPDNNPFYSSLTITGYKLSAAAGIDESNIDTGYVLLPSKVQDSANSLRLYIQRNYNVKNIGLVITDSRSTPLFLGTHGIALAYSGIAPLKDYIGTNDLFGHEIKISRLNIVNGLAAAAVTVMGEGAESTPFALITELNAVLFCEENPTQAELTEQFYKPKNDLYAEILQSDLWQKGGGGYLARQ